MALALVPIDDPAYPPPPWPHCLACEADAQRRLVVTTAAGELVALLPVCNQHGVEVFADPIRWELVEVHNGPPVLRRKET